MDIFKTNTILRQMPGSLRLFLWNWPVQEQVQQEQVQHQAEEEQAQQEETILWPVQQAGAGAGGDDSDESFFSHEQELWTIDRTPAN
jgi:hypothetical protein